MQLLYFAECSTPGYIGISCKTPCPTGTFGRGCAGNCSEVCPFENCHHEFGCPPGSSNVPKPTDSGKKPFINKFAVYVFTCIFIQN